MNDFIEYYTKYQILPVSQNLSELSIHHSKREKLYRQLGMPPIVFEEKRILEVGPGRGHNTLSFFEWGCSHVTLVEPNVIGVEAMEDLFHNQKIDEHRYDIKQCMIEDYQTEEMFDIVIAEGFLHSIENAREIISKLSQLVVPGGVMVITCMDCISMFVEQMKRLVGWLMIRDVEDYEEKVKICTDFFTPQFKNVTGMSRSVEDWVRDDMLNPAFNADTILNLIDGIESFPKDFSVLGTSQRMFTDYSWYKDLNYDERQNIQIQYRQKRHNLLMTGLEETVLTDDESVRLERVINGIRDLEKRYEATFKNEILMEIIQKLQLIQDLMDKIDLKCGNFVRECIEILQNEGRKANCSSFNTFYNAMGRTQQYLSMTRRKDYGKNNCKK